VELRVAGEPAVLRASVAHPFWVKRTSDETPHWINAANLKPGELAETIDGNWAEIQSVTPQPNEEIVYNFTVDKDHDYFVGQTGFLVHNANCPCKFGQELHHIVPENDLRSIAARGILTGVGIGIGGNSNLLPLDYF